MVVKAEDMKKRADEQKKERFERKVTSLENAIGREIRENLPAKGYRIPLCKCAPNGVDKEVLDTVMEHYRQAGWNVEYKPEGGDVYERWNGTRHYSNLLVLSIQNRSSQKNESGRVIHASTIEEKVIADEAEKFEREVKKCEEEIDGRLKRDCEDAEIWYEETGFMDAKMKERIKTIYEQAGWQVRYRIREMPWQSGRVDRIPCIVFKRQE
ncbi:MAG: hypothetical protein WC852_00820 [Candidatus Nanoarchaeia archaeon]|jgi:hypothetical protein